MYGRNPKRPPVKGDGTILQLQEVFHTCQGEGPFAGQAAVFIRLGGCNLACSFCDTEFESFHDVPVEQLVAKVTKMQRDTATSLTVITGGEPMRQPIERLCQMLLDAGSRVQVETNGTIYRDLDKAVSIVCSPKAVGGRYGSLRPDMLARVDALKFVMSEDVIPYNTVPDVGQDAHMPIYLQPMDVEDPVSNARNLRYTIHMAQRFGHQLSIQLHKMMDVA